MHPNAQKEATAMIECVMFVNSYVCGASGGAEEKRYAYLRRMLLVGIRISVQVCQSSVSSVKIFFGGASDNTRGALSFRVTRKRWCPNSNPIDDIPQPQTMNSVSC